MAQGFCDHLDDYSVLFGRAQASYENCLYIIDKIIEEMNDPELRQTLENALDEWVSETRRMQDSFANLVKDGSIDMASPTELSKGSQLESVIPVCCDCNFRVPRLNFPEFDLNNDQQPKFRGQELPLPVGVGA